MISLANAKLIFHANPSRKRRVSHFKPREFENVGLEF